MLAGLGLLIALGLVFVARWLNANKIGGQGPAEPFRIAGNFYYVGATDVSAFLITGPEGHVVLDAGYPTTAKLVMGSIAKLGFDIKDVKVLLNSEPHPDHAGGLSFRLLRSLPADIWVTAHAATAPSSMPPKRNSEAVARTSSSPAAVGRPPGKRRVSADGRPGRGSSRSTRSGPSRLVRLHAGHEGRIFMRGTEDDHRKARMELEAEDYRFEPVLRRPGLTGR